MCRCRKHFVLYISEYDMLPSNINNNDNRPSVIPQSGVWEGQSVHRPYPYPGGVMQGSKRTLYYSQQKKKGESTNTDATVVFLHECSIVKCVHWSRLSPKAMPKAGLAQCFESCLSPEAELNAGLVLRLISVVPQGRR